MAPKSDSKYSRKSSKEESSVEHVRSTRDPKNRCSSEEQGSKEQKHKGSEEQVQTRNSKEHVQRVPKNRSTRVP
ncbi:uncharacterized protein MYCFIDRAFT_172601 [Pseudocercospora fijiensis CIRAD86]|uniref:Uncharacterized protein n=1 Tax=Pseudocercospora fijiensis (strain CIRAD86) TaxID=383855 RepID=M3BCL3_PSEFD|nr:uncharacterized protein MYCFIDRAFT_172601 [Pseudocercospora fijiensis CIRAD86]EME86908.1 hypothetical protein MYCFIDRAFT_172601 [Pseudocercospora fijiensis CIRAD86]